MAGLLLRLIDPKGMFSEPIEERAALRQGDGGTGRDHRAHQGDPGRACGP
jgi:hypothetical protein